MRLYGTGVMDVTSHQRTDRPGVATDWYAVITAKEAKTIFSKNPSARAKLMILQVGKGKNKRFKIPQDAFKNWDVPNRSFEKVILEMELQGFLIVHRDGKKKRWFELVPSQCLYLPD
jgi:hypothetical protein